MALAWQIIAVEPKEAQREGGCGLWEPFAVSKDDQGEEVVLCKRLIEVESGKSSTLEENYPRQDEDDGA